MEVGERIGKSYKTVSGWEHGRGQPDADMFVALSNIYHIDNIAEFFSDAQVTPEVCPQLTPTERQYIDSFRQLNDEGQEKVIGYVNDLINTGTYTKKTDESEMVQKA